MLILFDNKFVKKALVDISGSMSRGYGIFETLRTFDKKVFQKKEHIDRLFYSAKKIGLKIKYKKTEISEMLERISQKSSFKNQRIKIIALEKDLIILSEKLKINPTIYKKGVSLKSVIEKRSLPEIKSISYLPSYLSHEKAVKQGYFDALLIDKNSEVYECAYANIFWFEGNNLCTRKDEVLAGTVRQFIIKKSPYKIKYKKIKLAELCKKEEIFITNSLSLIVPVTKIDNKKIGDGKPGDKTKKLFNIFYQTR